MTITGSGNVGIGTNSPSYPLDVVGYANAGTVRSYCDAVGSPWSEGGLVYNASVSIHSQYGIWAYGFVGSSDRRIKENIVDVSDNLALEMVRDIPCRYYEYKDKNVRGSNKTIGFIAQEVKEVLPMAVSIQTEIIPNEYRNLEEVAWDISENIYKLTTNLTDVSGVKYRFYVSNDPSGNDEIQKDIVGNPDNTFSFDSRYNNVFCYGKEVNDFHTLDKNKIFTLHHSSIQELDRQQQTDKARITVLETKVESQDTLIQTLISRIEALENN
jgi:hypothetical protein